MPPFPLPHVAAAADTTTTPATPPPTADDAAWEAYDAALPVMVGWGDWGIGNETATFEQLKRIAHLKNKRYAERIAIYGSSVGRISGRSRALESTRKRNVHAILLLQKNSSR